MMNSTQTSPHYASTFSSSSIAGGTYAISSGEIATGASSPSPAGTSTSSRAVAGSAPPSWGPSARGSSAGVGGGVGSDAASAGPRFAHHLAAASNATFDT